MILSRRRFLAGMLAAPAVIAAHKLMPVRLVDWGVPYEGIFNLQSGVTYSFTYNQWRQVWEGRVLGHFLGRAPLIVPARALEVRAPGAPSE